MGLYKGCIFYHAMKASVMSDTLEEVIYWVIML